MRNGCNILNGFYIKTIRLKRSDGRFPPRAGTLHKDVHRPHAHIHGFVCRGFGNHLSGKGGALAGTFETYGAGRTPADGIAVDISNGYDSVVEGGADVSYAARDGATSAAPSGFRFSLSHQDSP